MRAELVELAQFRDRVRGRLLRAGILALGSRRERRSQGLVGANSVEGRRVEEPCPVSVAEREGQELGIPGRLLGRAVVGDGECAREGFGTFVLDAGDPLPAELPRDAEGSVTREDGAVLDDDRLPLPVGAEAGLDGAHVLVAVDARVLRVLVEARHRARQWPEVRGDVLDGSRGLCLFHGGDGKSAG